MTNTAANIGIRRMIYSLSPPQYRNYEPKGGALYKVLTPHLEYAGTNYAKGDTIAFDSAGGTAYTNDDVMEQYFNAARIDPVS